MVVCNINIFRVKITIIRDCASIKNAKWNNIIMRFHPFSYYLFLPFPILSYSANPIISFSIHHEIYPQPNCNT